MLWLYSGRLDENGNECPYEPPDGEITANITSERREEPSVEPDLGDLERFGRVLKKLGKMDVRDRIVLEVLYGDAGALCDSRVKRLGRIVALFGLTKAGRALARLERKHSAGLKLSNMDLIQNAVAKGELREAPPTAPTWTPPNTAAAKTWREMNAAERALMAKRDAPTFSAMEAFEARQLVSEAHLQSIELRDKVERAYTLVSTALDMERPRKPVLSLIKGG
jgi:hypothetical protein